MSIPIPPKGPEGVTPDNVVEKFLAHAKMLEDDPEEMKKREAQSFGNPISLSPPVITEQAWVDKQITRTLAAGDEWEKNTLAPRKDPVAAAIAANEKRKTNLEEAERKGKWLKSMNQVDMSARQETIKAVGATGFKRGVEARRAKITNKIKKLRPLILAVKETIGTLPDATPEQREAKMVSNLHAMRAVGDAMRQA